MSFGRWVTEAQSRAPREDAVRGFVWEEGQPGLRSYLHPAGHLHGAGNLVLAGDLDRDRAERHHSAEFHMRTAVITMGEAQVLIR